MLRADLLESNYKKSIHS
uniref:Uncharacterized protein n=1 Tax=Anguilla anguilla TaxID=7936 RepID=A0A0E9XC95_ANGAN